MSCLPNNFKVRSEPWDVKGKSESRAGEGRERERSFPAAKLRVAAALYQVIYGQLEWRWYFTAHSTMFRVVSRRKAWERRIHLSLCAVRAERGVFFVDFCLAINLSLD